MASEARNPPATTNGHRWKHDRTGYPTEPCITNNCTSDAVALGLCAAHATARLTNAGIIQRRARALLDVVTDAANGTHDLTHTLGRREFIRQLTAAAETLADTLNDQAPA